MNISVTLGPISEREHFRNFKAYPGNISTPYFFFGALRARRGVPQYEAPLRGSARRRTAASVVWRLASGGRWAEQYGIRPGTLG